ncbi:MAG: hypothetical protein II191_06020 [Clostridia bacterium]|nr:hypothetical protein [Clostridia bacterium]
MNKKLVCALMALVMLAAVLTACSNGGKNNTVIIDVTPVTAVPVPTQIPSTEPPLYTVAPTPTAEPNITFVPSNTPQPAPDHSVFDNCAFVGNSTFEGLHIYGAITHGTFFTRVGLNIQSVYNLPTEDGKGKPPIIDELNSGSYQAVIMMFGENELGWPNINTFINKYEQFCRDVWTRQPGAKLFITGIPPVSAQKSATSTNGVTNENIQLYNSQLSDLCARVDDLYFITVPEALMTADGALPAEASGDGLHLNMTYSKYWADHICLSVMSVLRG